jgi:hypothetical protein
MNSKCYMYLIFLNPARGSLNTWMVSFIILSYHRFSETSKDRPADSANFGLARSISLCLSALPVPRRACKAKRKCLPTVFPSSREMRLWNHLQFFSVVPRLNIGWTYTVGLSIFLPSESSNNLTEVGLPSDGSASFSSSGTYGICTKKSGPLWLSFPIVGTWIGQMPDQRACWLIKGLFCLIKGIFS